MPVAVGQPDMVDKIQEEGSEAQGSTPNLGSTQLYAFGQVNPLAPHL